MIRVPLYLLEAAASSRISIASSAFRLASAATPTSSVSGSLKPIRAATSTLPSRQLSSNSFSTVTTESEETNPSEEPQREEASAPAEQKTPPPAPVTIESILSKVAVKPVGVRDACALTVKLAKLGFRADTDHRFNRLLSVVSGPKTTELNSMSLLSLHKALESMGVKGSAMPNTENALTWRLRQDDVSDLMHVMSYFFNRRGSDTGKKLFAELVATVERRWFEVDDSHTFVSILHYGDTFSQSAMNKFEDRIAEMAEDMSAVELATIYSKMGSTRRRSIPLLRALAFNLQKKRSDESDPQSSLNMRHISNCLFAMSQLSYVDKGLLDYLCEQFSLDKVDRTAVVRSSITSLGRLRYLQPKVMDSIAEWMHKRVDVLNTKDLAQFLITSANLNYAPASSQILFDEIKSRVTPKELGTSVHVWLDVVWSLCILGLQEHKHLESVLTADFCIRLLNSHLKKNGGGSTGIQMKLLNVNAAAQFLTPGYKGPLLNLDDHPALASLPVKEGKMQISQSILSIFFNIASPPTHSRTHVDTQMGFVVDAECVLESKNASQLRPVEITGLQGLGIPLDQVQSIKENQCRVALLVVSFSEGLVSRQESGIVSLNRRLLEARGYKVLCVRHDDLSPKADVVTKTKELIARLKMSLQ